MQRQVFDATAKFHVTDAMLAAAREKASEKGMTVSELIRHALRRELRRAA